MKKELRTAQLIPVLIDIGQKREESLYLSQMILELKIF